VARYKNRQGQEPGGAAWFGLLPPHRSIVVVFTRPRVLQFTGVKHPAFFASFFSPMITSIARSRFTKPFCRKRSGAPHTIQRHLGHTIVRPYAGVTVQEIDFGGGQALRSSNLYQQSLCDISLPRHILSLSVSLYLSSRRHNCGCTAAPTRYGRETNALIDA
jgi:hypothetical protein